MNLLYCLMVTGPAYGNQRASSALQFAKALLNCGHSINTVFFYQDGVYNANRLVTPSSDEINLVQSWYNLTQKYQINLHVCVSAALRRGIIDTEQAKLLQCAGENLQFGFQLSSLSNLSQAVLKCDRFIQF